MLWSGDVKRITVLKLRLSSLQKSWQTEQWLKDNRPRVDSAFPDPKWANYSIASAVLQLQLPQSYAALAAMCQG